MENWDALSKELEACLIAGQKLQFWWRDDGSATVTPQLERLLDVAASCAVKIGFAVVPSKADHALAARLKDAPAVVWQHGWAQREHGSGEFGEGRSIDDMVNDVLLGRHRMDDVFGPGGWQKVFVPPFHQLSMEMKSLLATLGFSGLSSGHPRTAAVADLPEVNAEIDLVDGRNGAFMGDDAVLGQIVDEIRRRRLLGAEALGPIGLLSHHLVHGEGFYSFMGRLLPFLKSHGTEIVDPTLFFLNAPVAPARLGAPSRSMTVEAAQEGVSVVLTSCGRQDLLERTIDSFLRFNTHPIEQFLVVEDGPLSANQALQEKYASHGIHWMSTEMRVGQIKAIDFAYARVETPYVFHCEDDWEFLHPAFIEKSLMLLDSDPHILQVRIRALDDTNGHPLSATRFFAGEIPFHVFDHDFAGGNPHDGGYSDIWHGFSFNPGLRRMREYHLLGSFGSLDPASAWQAYRVEQRASEFYRDLGYYAVALADEQGQGYVRHIGGERHVADEHLL